MYAVWGVQLCMQFGVRIEDADVVSSGRHAGAGLRVIYLCVCSVHMKVLCLIDVQDLS